jgi:hypothetical protein
VLNGVLEVVIGLVFIFLVLSLIGSGIQELIAAAVGLRANKLEAGIRSLLGEDTKPKDEQTNTNTFYEHALIKAMTGRHKPSYIPSRTFALTVMDLFIPAPHSPSDTAKSEVRVQIDSALTGMAAGPLKDALTALWHGSEKDIDKYRASIEQWFDDAMQRVSGWYTRTAKLILLVIGLGLAIGLNVDSYGLANTLWKDPALRSAVDEQAKAVVKSGSVPPGSACSSGSSSSQDPNEKIVSNIGCLHSLRLPIGWGKNNPANPARYPGRILGWIITGFAISLGAPFWFNMLQKVIRSTGPPPAPSQAAAPATSGAT